MHFVVTKERPNQRRILITRSYSELSRLRTFEERFDYLQLNGVVGRTTFGFERHINQKFYTSIQWRQIRQRVIARDEGLDLGIPGFEIHHNILIHHMNPIDADEIMHGDPDILDPEFLITTTLDTHNAIHYGDATKLAYRPFLKERLPGDTKLW